MKNKIGFLLLLLCTFSFTVNGQEKGDRKDRPHNHKFNYEQFKQKKARYITKEVGLTKEEAKAFMPLADELMSKKFELNKELRRAGRELRNKKDKSDANFDEFLKKSYNVRIKEAQLEKEYYHKFKKVLSSEKIFKYQNAEKKFVKEVLEKDRD